MELALYADYAVRLVNSEEPERGTDALVSVDAVRALFASPSSRGAQLTETADLPRLRAVRGGCARSSRPPRPVTRPAVSTC